VISLLSICTISTGGAVVLGLPQVFVMSVAFSLFMLLVLGLRVDIAPLQFAFLYLLSVMPGTVCAAIEGDLEGRSFVQLIASLGTFVIVSSFVMKWLDVSSEDATRRALEVTIWAFAAFGAVEIWFWGWFYDLRTMIYGVNAIPYAEFRDTLLYGMPRPTGMFSEASNYARFMGILVAAYLIVSRRALRALLYILALMLLSRSPSMLFAAPAMVLGFMNANPEESLAGFWKQFATGLSAPMLVLGGLLFSVLAIVSQAERLETIGSGGDRSFNERVRDPVMFLVEDWDSPVLGSGATAHNDFIGITKGEWLPMGSQSRNAPKQKRLVQPDKERTAIATTFAIFAAMGGLGFGIFVSGIALLQGWNGLIFVGAFLFSNFLTAGYNSATMWVPCALLFSLCWRVLSGQKAKNQHLH